MGSMYWGLPGIMKLDPTGQELWDGGGVKGRGNPEPKTEEGGVSTQELDTGCYQCVPTSLSTLSWSLPFASK